jgi:hypothetical protein
MFDFGVEDAETFFVKAENLDTKKGRDMLEILAGVKKSNERKMEENKRI